MLWGPPGTGKTTIARLVAGVSEKAFETLSAVSAGVKDVREVAERARARLGERGQGTILFLDEVHRFSRAQQDVLLPFVEEGLLVLVGATTENPFFSLTGPLLSRSTLFRLEPLDDDDARASSRAARSPTTNAASATNRPTIDDDALEHLVDKSEGDARHLLTVLEVAHALTVEARPRRDHARTTPKPRSRCAASTTATTSTTTSSPRSSSRSAAPIPTPASTGSRGCSKRARTRASSRAGSSSSRREDVGLADPHAILVAEAAARAVEYVGLPEAAINLAHAVIHLALAPKSNSVIAALGAAPRRRCATAGPARCRCTCGTRTTAAPSVWATARATSILTTRRRDGCRRSTCPAEVAGERFYRPGPSRRRARAVDTAQAARSSDDGEDATTMSTGDVLAVVAATHRDDARRACSPRRSCSLDAHAARSPRHRRRACATKRSRCSTTHATRYADADESRSTASSGSSPSARARRRREAARLATPGREGDGVRNRRVTRRAALARGRAAAGTRRRRRAGVVAS